MPKKTSLIIINSLLAISFFSYGMSKMPNENLQITESKSSFRLFSYGNVHYLLDPNDNPFFTIGVNHISAMSWPSPMPIFESKYNGNWNEAAEDIKRNLYKWNFNSAGYGTPPELQKLMPFMMPCQPLVQNSGYHGKEDFSYADIFDPKVKKNILNKIKNMTRVKDNPNLIGYYWTDTPMWDLERSRRRFGINWVDFIKNLPDQSPGKIKYLEFKRSCLLKQYPAKDEEFLKIIAKEYYGLIGPETKRLDPDTLIFGERYLSNNHPQGILDEALPYIDVVAIQPFGDRFNGDYFDRLYAYVKKPIIICDHQCSFPTHNHKNTMWLQLESQEDVCYAYQNFLFDAAEKPYIIGYHRCQYMDRFNEHIMQLKQGMVQENGSAYEPHASLVTEINKKAIFIFSKRIKQ